jgi:hypothetical protein
MYKKRQEIEDAISSLREFLLNEDSEEEHFQRWFENNPIAFKALGYKRFIPHPKFKLEGEESLIPDFLVQRPDNIWEIFELKLPKTRILKDKKTRQTFYAPMSEYIQQCIDYSNYFKDSPHRKKFNENEGVDLHYEPNSVLVVGRNEGLERDKVFERLKDRGNRVSLVTYDDIITQLEFYKVQCLEKCEDLNGFSIHLVMLLSKIHNEDKNQLMMIGDDSERNCISIYLNNEGSLCFEVIDSIGTSYSSKVRQSSKTFSYNQVMYCNFELGISDDYSITSIEINGKYYSFNTIDRLEFDFKNSTLPIVLGSSNLTNTSSHFELFEHIIWSKTLNLSDRIVLRQNVFDHFSKIEFSSRTSTLFVGKRFLHSNAHPKFEFNPEFKATDLVQSDNNREPNLICNGKLLNCYLSVFYDQSCS